MLIKNFNIKLIILISIFFFQTLLSTKGDDLRIEIDNPKFSEKGLNDNVYEIKAKKGFKSENELELFVVEGKFKSEKNGKWIYLEADKGSFSQSTNLIVLEKNIIFYTDDGEKIHSDRAIFDMNNNIIKLSENVSHRSIEGLIISDNSIISDNFNKISYTGNVKSEINNIE
tara:strand:+ start:35 stop:547 length:513 start_codon:yes stop_codon:yes gene_type:complete